MPVFDQGYQHWRGKLSGHAGRWLTITRHGVRAQMKGRLLRIVLLAAWAPALALAGALIVWGLIEQKSTTVAPLLQAMRMLGNMADNPQVYRVPVWTLAYSYFLQTELYFSMLLVLLVGPGLISQDLRFNALPLYFARPLRRIDYFMGKLGVIAFFLGSVTVLPAVGAYVLGVCFSLDLGVVKDTFPILLRSVVYGMVIAAAAGLLMLALSSLSRSSRYVAAFWVGVWFVSGVVGGVVGGIHQSTIMRAEAEREWREVQNQQRDPRRNQRRGMEASRQFYDRMGEVRLRAVRSDRSSLLYYTGNLQRVGGALLESVAAWLKVSEILPPPRDFFLATRLGPDYPWYWSAGVLAALCGLSLWILTSRVKSLDRLR